MYYNYWVVVWFNLKTGRRSWTVRPVKLSQPIIIRRAEFWQRECVKVKQYWSVAVWYFSLFSAIEAETKSWILNFSLAQNVGTIVQPVRLSPLLGLGIAQVRIYIAQVRIYVVMGEWWNTWIMECLNWVGSACWNWSVMPVSFVLQHHWTLPKHWGISNIIDLLSLRSVCLETRAPLHVRGLLRWAFQPSILRPLPGMALAGGPLLHIPQLTLCLDWWEFSFKIQGGQGCR